MIGVDFDNTLVSYDRLMGSVAAGRGLVPAEAAASKRQIRDAIQLRTPGRRVRRAHAGAAWARNRIAPPRSRRWGS